MHAQCVGTCSCPCICPCLCRVFDAAAVELCARSVASSSGDLRQGLKACRLALDLLDQRTMQRGQNGEEEQEVVGSATVGVRDMMAALHKLAGELGGDNGRASVAPQWQPIPNKAPALKCSHACTQTKCTRHPLEPVWCAQQLKHTLPPQPAATAAVCTVYSMPCTQHIGRRLQLA